MQVHQLAPLEAVASLKSTPSGLSRAEVGRRLKEYGRNGVEAVPREPVWLRLIREFGSFFSLILWVAAGLAFFAAWRDPAQQMAQVGIAIVAVILVSGMFSFWQESRVERTLVALRRLLPQQAQVLREGLVTRVSAEELVPGDIVLLEQGDNIPADCRLIEAFSVRVNNAAVTGEALPQAREADASRAQEMVDSRNVVLAGTSIASGRARGVVFATGARTEFGKIARLSQTTSAEVSPLRRQIAHLSRVTAMLALTIGGTFFCAGWLIGIPSSKAFIFAIGIIVAMVPEGLLPTLTLALALATQRMARRKVLIRYLPAVEALGSTTVICTDKTGTLTQNRMTVRGLYLGGGPTTPAELARQPERVRLFQPLFLAARMCHDLSETPGPGHPVLQGDPMEVALVEMALQLLPGALAFTRLDEVPFDADRMRLSTLHQSPEGPTLYCKGAPEAVLPLCPHRLLDGACAPLDLAARAAIVQAQEAMAQKGLRVLALAFRRLGEDQDRTRLGAGHGLRRPGRTGRSAAAGSPAGAAQVQSGRDQGHHGHGRPPSDGPGDRA
jgi:sodium/potassium-transporting ATPase subunit alpha